MNVSLLCMAGIFRNYCESLWGYDIKGYSATLWQKSSTPVKCHISLRSIPDCVCVCVYTVYTWIYWHSFV